MSSNELPKFIRTHLERIAKAENFDNYTIQHESGSKHGDGFMSAMIAITLSGTRIASNGELTDHRLQLICKRTPESEKHQQEFKTRLLFAREVLVYNTILPALEQLQRDHGLPEQDGFFAYPKCYVAEFDPNNVNESVIIMQDLRALGFRLWEKNRITTVENTRLLLQQLGRLHALSFVLRDQKPEVFAKFEAIPDNMIQSIDTIAFRSMFDSSCERAIEVLDVEEDRKSLQHILHSYIELIVKAFDVKNLGKFAVMSHGDCWNNNMMFTFEGDVATNICLVDWQISHMCSPASDVANYLLSNTDKSMRDTHLDEFLQFYHSTVSQTIVAFGSDPEKLFSYADFQLQLKQFGYYAVLFVPLVIPVLLADPEQITDMDAVAANAQTGDGQKTNMAHLTEKTEIVFRQRLSNCVADARAYGWLDGLN